MLMLNNSIIKKIPDDLKITGSILIDPDQKDIECPQHLKAKMKFAYRPFAELLFCGTVEACLPNVPTLALKLVFWNRHPKQIAGSLVSPCFFVPPLIEAESALLSFATVWCG